MFSEHKTATDEAEHWQNKARGSHIMTAERQKHPYSQYRWQLPGVNDIAEISKESQTVI